MGLNHLPDANVKQLRAYAHGQLEALGSLHPDAPYYGRMLAITDKELNRRTQILKEG